GLRSLRVVRQLAQCAVPQGRPGRLHHVRRIRRSALAGREEGDRRVLRRQARKAGAVQDLVEVLRREGLRRQSMDIASVAESKTGELTILGIPIEQADKPFIEYWRKKIPHDFEDTPLKRHWLNFELGGIRRGKEVLDKLAQYVSVKDKVF